MPNINTQLKALFGKSNALSEAQLATVEKELLATYKVTTKELKNIIGEVYLKHGNDVTFAQMSKFDRYNKMMDSISDKLKATQKITIKAITNSIHDSYSQNYYHTGYSMEKTLQAKMGFQEIRPETLKAITTNPYKAFDWNNSLKEAYNTTYKQMTSTMTEGLVQGYGYKKTAKLMTARMDINFNKALRIVQTESHRAQTQGRLDAFGASEKAADDLGVDVARVWDATMDSKTRSEHIQLDGDEANDDNLFTVSGHTAEGPGLFGVAALDINCRCVVQMVILDMPPEVKKNNETGEIVPQKDYDEWKKKRIKQLEKGKTKSTTSKQKPKGKTPQKLGFKPAETNKEIAKRFDNIGIKNFDPSASIASNNEMLKSFESLNKDGYSMRNIGTVRGARTGELSKRAYAGYSPDTNTIHYDPRKFSFNSRTTERLLKDVSTGYHPKDTGSIKALFDHEYAHSVTHGRLTQGAANKFKAIQADYFNEFETLKGKLFKAEHGSKVYNTTFERMKTIKISNYAKMNIDEFISEGFTMFRNSSTPSPYAVRIGKLVKEVAK